MGLQEGIFPVIENGVPEEEIPTIIDEQLRLFYVGCTRAMRSLMVCASRSQPSQFLTSLLDPLWQRQEIL